MALRILLPDDLNNKSGTYVVAALEDLKAEPVSGGEWHFKRGVLTPDEFRTRLKVKLAQRSKLADRVIIEILRPKK